MPASLSRTLVLRISWIFLTACCLSAPLSVIAEDFYEHSFERIKLTGDYYSEGANFGDINGDGHMDVVHGPFWFAGPEFSESRTIYPPRPQPRQGYADNFFNWVVDVNGDGHADVLTVGFPSKPAYVYQNPGPEGWDKIWPQHEVLDWVSNESPQFVDLVGDSRRELVCTREGYFGYAVMDPEQPFGPWKFHPISEQVAPKQFGHGLGVGDVNGDGRADILMKDGWFEQPAESGPSPWAFHAVPFAPRGGAEMYAYDVDGDGDSDIITSLAAHEFGLAWWEQTEGGNEPQFKQHLIMGSKPEDNKYGVVFSELHSVNLVDMDGDGLKDIVTGKTYWSHHTQSPMWDAGAVVYWFRLVRTEDGVDWVPYKADDESGIGRQLTVGDLNGDQLPDLVVGGMKGANVLLHRRKPVTREQWELIQPRPHVAIQAGLEPEAAARNMTAPAGFQVRLAAGEPAVHQPIAFTIDHRGRLWVAEAYTYPIRAPEGQGRDKIVILEDTTGDGQLNSRKVFAEGLNLVSGLEVGFGGVWVGAAPYLMFIPDRDGDDTPDAEPQILLDGFGYQDTHETLNAFIWGPDGWLYGCHGVFTHSRVGKPGTPDDQRTPLNAGVWRYHPVRHEFEVFAWGTSNPWGVDFNDQGQAFITACVIPHLWHMIQGARYQRQGGRHFGPYVFEDIQTIAVHRHYVGNIRDHAWWGQEPDAPKSTLDAGGGHAHCGAMIYLGDAWPDQYRNQIFMHNIHGNRVNNDRLERKGSGYQGNRAPDLVLANDKWFRGINLKYGPDGSVYMIDWYDQNACHRTNPEIWDRTNGRIYNVSYGTSKPLSVDLESLSDRELVTLHLRNNDWFVRMARRILQHRAASGQLDESVTAELWKIASTHSEATRRLRAIWTLHAINQLTERQRLELLKDTDEYVRGWAIQLEFEDRSSSPEVIEALQVLAESDPSPVVRLYLASALQRMKPGNARKIVDRLVAHAEDAQDHNLPLMYWYGSEPLVAADVGYGIDLVRNSKISTVSRYTVRRLCVEKDGLDAVVALLSETRDADVQTWILAEMVQAFEGRVTVEMPASWKVAYETLTRSSNESIRDQADQLAVIFGDRRIFPRMRVVLADKQQPMAKRQQAMQILVRGRDAESTTALLSVLDEAALRPAALKALATFDDTEIPDRILGIYSDLSVDEKRDAINTLVARPQSARKLLVAMADNRIPRTDIHAYHVRQMMRFNDDSLAREIRTVWGEIRQSSEQKQAEIERFRQLLNPAFLKTADVSNGRRLFAKSCATCHTLFGEGRQIGPDITGSNRANLDYILTNVLDPSAVLGKDYQLTVIVTADGRVVSGMVKDENEDAVTLQTINEVTVVSKREIEERQLSNQSMMPERLLEPLSSEEVRDLVAYLASPTQVALRGPRAPIDPATKRVPGAIEAESMKIVGKTDGQARSQAMGGFTTDRWSGEGQLWWTGARPGSKLELEVNVTREGIHTLECVLTRARDYGIVQLRIDDQNLGAPIDLYNNPEVMTTGVLTFEGMELTKGPHRFSIEIIGANEQAVKSFMVGLDYVRLVRLPMPGDE